MEIEEVLNHWKYFLSLEKDILKLKNYIEIHQENFDVYSFELSKLLQLSCSEIDSVCRLLCKTIDPKNNYFDESIYSGKISQYKNIILQAYPLMIKTEIYVPDLGINIYPWEKWGSENSPGWWKGYNNVKHYRHNCFKEANLKNTLYAMSALMVLILYLYRIIDSTPYAVPMSYPDYFRSENFGSYVVSRGDKDLPDFEETNS